MCIESTKEKIKKLLKLSESPNEFEAQRAIMKAQELACKFNIEIESINIEEDEELVVDEAVTSKKTVSIEERAISSIIAKNFKVQNYILDSCYYGKQINVIGLPEDVEIFKTVFEYAMKNFKKFRKEFIKEYKKTHRYFNMTAIKNSYLFGFIKGLEDKFKENVMEYALIVVTPALVKKYVNNIEFQTSRSSRRTVSRDSGIKDRGYADGRKSAM